MNTAPVSKGVRLLELRGAATAEQRMSFFYGAMLEGEVRAELERLGRGGPERGGLQRILVSGPEALAAPLDCTGPAVAVAEGFRTPLLGLAAPARQAPTAS